MISFKIIIIIVYSLKQLKISCLVREVASFAALCANIEGSIPSDVYSSDLIQSAKLKLNIMSGSIPSQSLTTAQLSKANGKRQLRIKTYINELTNRSNSWRSNNVNELPVKTRNELVQQIQRKQNEIDTLFQELMVYEMEKATLEQMKEKAE